MASIFVKLIPYLEPNLLKRGGLRKLQLAVPLMLTVLSRFRRYVRVVPLRSTPKTVLSSQAPPLELCVKTSTSGAAAWQAAEVHLT